MITLRKLAPVALVMATLSLSACGGEDESASSGAGGRQEEASAAARLRLASASTLEEKSSRFSISMLFPGAGNKPFTSEGIADFTGQRMSMTSDLSGLGAPEGQGKMEQRLIGSVMYMKADFFSQGLPRGKSWVKMDLETMSQQAGIPFKELIEQSRNTDPSGPINYLRGVQGKVETVGKEQVRGVDTTHYRFTINLEKATGELSPELREKMKPILSQMGPQMPGQAWLDDEGLVRRMAYEIAMPPSAGATTPQKVTTTMEFFDFGVAPDIAEPPANQVVDFQQVMKASGLR